MVNLNDTQSTLRRNVEREKAQFDTDWEAELTRHKAREEELKRPVRAAISLADQAGVPQLQIARAAGFNQVNQLLNWMRDKTGGNLLASALSAPQRPLDALHDEAEAAVRPLFLEVDKGMWQVTLNGEPVDYTLFNYQGNEKVVIVDGLTPNWFYDTVLAWAADQGFEVHFGWPENDE